jgi:hypothetical protein
VHLLLEQEALDRRSVLLVARRHFILTGESA